MRDAIKKFTTLGLIIFVVLVVMDGYLWFLIFSGRPVTAPRDNFLDVGQGDGELIVLAGGAKIMTDAGPTDKVLDSLAEVMPQGDHYIDVAIISHPQLDHFNGYNFILDHYNVGVFIYNGRDDDPGVAEWPQLKAKIKAKHIPLITLAAGDEITYGQNEIDLLSPNWDFDQSAELNDTGFVELIKTPAFRTLLTADIGFNVEDYLVQNGYDIRADVLKVPHHGSNYSSGDTFLRAVDPKIAVIEVGAHNTYGHPGKRALARLASSTTAEVLRTDQKGTITVYAEGGKLKVLLYNNEE